MPTDSAAIDTDGEDFDVLARLALFGALTDETIEFLLARCETVAVPAGECFFAQDQIGDAVFVLRSGRAEVVHTTDGHSLVLAELGPGRCFGEMALMAISPRCATVRALEDCSALRLRNMAILELYRRDPEQFTLLQMNLGREVARRLTVANDTLFEHARRSGDTTPGHPLLARAASMLQ
jgi:CRP-like cAMP-binding protein